ncbi:acyl carrier protein [Streptomyces sp. NBC_00893]|uniref:acyl carrier protein n=1 Tax=Streptomyces sp. NBC_00893 TaxID=2975862 RepID=UPI00224F29A1|nr:acyl carrier protein [Streptomyces sp. NBC_00893]MCX4844624.1 acyl carrier protein [Streptomyces sp. NBC_00893]
MLTDTAAKDAVMGEIKEILLEDLDENAAAIIGHEELIALGLNSLMLARLILRLNSVFDTNPFADETVSVADIRTADQLVTVYTRSRSAGRPV